MSLLPLPTSLIQLLSLHPNLCSAFLSPPFLAPPSVLYLLSFRFAFPGSLHSGLGFRGLVQNAHHTSTPGSSPLTIPPHLSSALLSSPRLSPLFWVWAAATGSVVLWVGAVFRQTCFFCRAFVPFCVIVLTERTPHLPGSCAPGLGLTLSHVSGCNLMAVFILCRLSLKALRKSLAFLSQRFGCPRRGACSGNSQEE